VRQKREPTTLNNEPFDVVSNVELPQNENPRSERLDRALQALPDQQREVIVLKHIEGWSYEEIATASGDSVGTLKVRAHRARLMMKEFLLELEENPRSSRPRTPPAPADGKERENG
jgi:RNA polymerase sigma factor (sigma-70 family)